MERFVNQAARCIAVVLFAISVAAPAASIPAQVSAALRDAQIPLESTSIVIQEVGAPAPLVSHRAETPMNPASVMKLVTTFTALDALGPGFTWKTEAFLDGELKDGTLSGTLILKGYGDP